MSTTTCALKGKLGSTEYYVITMKAGDVVSKIRIPKEIEGWKDLGIEERYQRKINDSRVKKFIAPYLAKDEDRFFGSLLVTMQNAEDIEFEPLTDVVQKLPVAYKTSAKKVGFLTLSGAEIMFPLDGQHRLRAIKYAIDGKDSSGKDLDNFSACSSLAKEDVVVILFVFDSKKARKIFTKVNKYAKPTTAADNLITDDDNVIAVITRKMANDEIGARMVNFESNTLSNQSKEFTTLNTLSKCIESILDAIHGKIDTVTRPSKDKETLYLKTAKQNIKTLLEKIDHFKTQLTDTGDTGDAKRQKLRKKILLTKPIAQLCLVKAFMEIKSMKTSNGRTPTDDEICKALNKIDWDMHHKNWQKVLMNGKRIMSGKETINLAYKFIIYYSGFMLEEEKKKLLEQYKNSFIKEEQEAIKSLPKS